MKKETVKLMTAPAGMQPGGYVMKAYADRVNPAIEAAQLEVENAGQRWRIQLRWACDKPLSTVQGETDLFPDACAIFVPTTAGAPWITMGDKGKAVEGLLWRADQEKPMGIRAEGMGTMQRSAAQDDWSVKAAWSEGYWTVTFQANGWAALKQHQQVALAIWRGSAQDRGGLKSVSQGWIAAV